MFFVYISLDYSNTLNGDANSVATPKNYVFARMWLQEDEW